LEFSTSILAVLALVICGCGGPPPPPPPAFDGAAALETAREFVALGPKDAGTPGAARAAEWIRARVESLGWEAGIDEFLDGPEGGELTFRNVVARRRGAGPGIVLFGAHFDTKSGIPGFEGANDSASGVAALLGIARVYSRAVPPCEFRLAFFDGEECRVAYGPNDGLHGSRRLARHAVEQGWAREVRAVIILDMIGDRDLTVTVPRNGTPALLTAVFEAARIEGVRDRFRLAPGDILDDHVPFLEAGMPAVDLIDFEFGSAPGLNDHWHTPGDSMDKLSADSLAIAARVALRVSAAAASRP
jgi:glutaminyl-peptide cyclotransferase